MKRQKTEDVEVPITPMLDMAFQLLTFFILTYHPAPTEGQFSMNLLPAQPSVSLETPAGDKNAANNDLPAGVKTLPTTLRANDEGLLAEIFIEDNKIDGLEALGKELEVIFKDKSALPFDQTEIKIDPKLKYAEVVKVIDLFSKHITKISLTELGAGRAAVPTPGSGRERRRRASRLFVLPRGRAPRPDSLRRTDGGRLAGDPQLRPEAERAAPAARRSSTPDRSSPTGASPSTACKTRPSAAFARSRPSRSSSTGHARRPPPRSTARPAATSSIPSSGSARNSTEGYRSISRGPFSRPSRTSSLTRS